MKKFDMGRVVATRGVYGLMNRNKSFRSFTNGCLDRYQKCDFGDLCDDDRQANDEALVEGDRIFASYNFPQDVDFDCDCDKLWIITEWDRSITTMLFPSEY